MHKKTAHVRQHSFGFGLFLISGPKGFTRKATHAMQWRLMVAVFASFSLAQSASAVQLIQGTTGQFGSELTAPIDITNNDAGVTYDSLMLDSGLADLVFSAYGVSDLYNNDFQDFLNSGAFGFDIDGTSQVQNGWNSSNNSDGTISIQQGQFGGEDFNTNKTMTGNYFFLKSLLDADGDGKDNYTFHLLSDAQDEANFSSPLTKISNVGSNLNGNFLEAYAGIDAFSSSGQAYALVPTNDHPAIPEPAKLALYLGLGALITLVLRKRRQA